MWHYVYVITNNINGKRYVGKHSTNNLDDGYMGSGVTLKGSQKRYGIENFSKRIVNFFDTEDEAYAYEERYIARVDAVKNDRFYNVINGGIGFGSGENHPYYGKTLSEETRQKMSEARKGKNNPNFGKPMSEEQKRKISEAKSGENNYWYGRKHSEDTKRKMSEWQKDGNNPMLGKKHSEESRKRMSEAHRGEKNSMFGRTRSEEDKRMQSEQKGTPHKATFPDGTWKMFTSLSAIAKHFNVSKATISKIVKSGKPYEVGKIRNQFISRYDLEGITIEKLPKNI